MISGARALMPATMGLREPITSVAGPPRMVMCFTTRRPVMGSDGAFAARSSAGDSRGPAYAAPLS